AEARRVGIARLFTEASITARPLFEALGFRVLTPQVVTLRAVEFINYRMERLFAEPAAAAPEAGGGSASMKWDHFNPPALPDWGSFFSQVVCVERHGTKQVFVAGQVGVDAQKRLVGDGGFAAQTEQAFDNLGAALAHVGGKWSDVAMLT